MLERIAGWFRKSPKKINNDFLPPVGTPQPIIPPAVTTQPVPKESSRKFLQKLDELLTIGTEEINQLNIQMHRLDRAKKEIEYSLEKAEEEWERRDLLLKLERTNSHSSNTLQRLEIFHQNLNIYHNMISQIQKMDAMKLGAGIDEEKIETLWVEFKEQIEHYQEITNSHEVTRKDQEFHLAPKLEENLNQLKKELEAKRPPIKTTDLEFPEEKKTVEFE